MIFSWCAKWDLHASRLTHFNGACHCQSKLPGIWNLKCNCPLELYAGLYAQPEGHVRQALQDVRSEIAAERALATANALAIADAAANRGGGSILG
jgi:hypothetical protein